MLLAVLTGCVLGCSSLAAATFTLINADDPGEGLNDPTPAAPVGLNPGTTLGEQRLFALEHAMAIWGARLESTVPIVVQARFDPLDCSSSTGTLGSSGPYTFFRDFRGAPLPGTYFPVALANAFAAIDLDPDNPDVVAVFNANVGSTECLSNSSWYYGLDGQAPQNAFDFLEVVLHELAHGLGFSTLVNLNTGAKPNGFDDAYMRHLEDHTSGLTFPVMTDAQRSEAMIRTGQLHWVGSNVVAQSDLLTAGHTEEGHVEMFAPNPLQPGSSVTHFSAALVPDDLMEPYAKHLSDQRLTTALFQDLGWDTLLNAPQIHVAGMDLLDEDCPPPNQAIDPGEVVTLLVALENIGSGVTRNLVATLLPDARVSPLSPPQSYGFLAAGAAAQSRPFTLSVQAACGATVQASFALQDDTNDLGILHLPLLLGQISSTSHTASNPNPIQIPAGGKSGPASPYPASLTVSGLPDSISRVTVTLHNLSHTFPDQLDLLLRGPEGQSVLFMSDAGGAFDLAGVSLTFDDAAASALPDAGPIRAGTFRPTDFGAPEDLPPPAPPGPYSSTLEVFRDFNPNGTWQLFIRDDGNPDSGQLLEGWSLALYTDSAPICCESADQMADLQIHADTIPEVIAARSDLTLHMTVTNAGPDVSVGTILSNPAPVNATIRDFVSSRGTGLISNNTFFCSLGNIDPGGVASVDITLLSGAGGFLTNDVSVQTRSTDPAPGNNEIHVALRLNASPILSSVSNQFLLEDTLAGPIPFRIEDPDSDPEVLTLSIESSNTNLLPSGSFQIEGTGPERTLSFRPAHDQSGLAAITVTARDELSAASSAFLARVDPVNDAPLLAPIADQYVVLGSTLIITNQATDVDNAPDTLRFGLRAAPSGVLLDPVSGLMNWTPESGDAGSTYSITVTVTDNGSPSLSHSQSFLVTVSDLPRIDAIVVDGPTITLSWLSQPGLSYRLQFKDDLSDPTWTDLPGSITASGTAASISLPLSGSRRFYRLVLISTSPLFPE